MAQLPTGSLAVELENVTSKQVGTWHLKVWNRFGFDAVNFTVETTAIIIGAALAVFGVTTLTIAVAIMCRFRQVTLKSCRLLAGRSPGLPPPPAPHTFRRPAPDAVMFRVQPDGQDGRVSFLGVQDHTYEVMPGEESTDSDPTASDSTSNADCFLHIACPSSDSSLSEEDLRSIASTEVIPAPMMTRASETSSTQQAMEETDGNEAAMCKDVGVPRAFLQPVASSQEEDTRPLEEIYENTTTLRTNSSLKQPPHSSPKATPRVPKTSASKTTGTRSGSSSDDYLHPIASGREEASAPKTMLQPFQTTTKRSWKPPADYLHPIASVHK
ncbi:uncharacterized protein [Littorina saxatilis]|uniref:uncharacterized protein n=1 Tax=Littorina saxatilis TaxID=31220 RepID=UPI0038B68BB3